jgi:ectoine hydroxylase-related dioxygenase (phytanoyl-CoA dioxygenase family)
VKLFNDLSDLGYSRGYFPFKSYELAELDHIIKDVHERPLFERKNLFLFYPELNKFFKDALGVISAKIILTDYCFYIEKNQSKNWPLAMHRDVNFPDYVKNFPDFYREQWLQKGFWFRLNLDASSKDEGALKVRPGSHLDQQLADEVVLENEAGEVIFFSPLLYHGSAKMKTGKRRRVLQAFCLHEKNDNDIAL